ncbi:MAG: hypothetical protein NZ531_00575, partial [Aquificaceae bacterium]|nr:hypothetical protein [Aquificaceae bacterium]
MTLLTFHRSLLENPLELSLEQQLALFDSKNYRSQYAYLVFKASPDNSRIVDASIVKTYVTLKLIDRQARQKGLALLLHPQPISIPQGFWREWKTAKTSSDRIDLVKKYGLAKDENIFVLARIIVDVDQPYETAQETVLKVFQKLGIDNGFLLGKSKSGNLRGVIWLSPTNILVGYKIVKEEKHEIYKDFYLSPHTKHKNGHTHLENLKELLAILYGLLEK